MLFTDQHQTNILIEVKAVAAKYDNAAQLAKYKEASGSRGEGNILMWLVAPCIPTSVRELPDRVGIEYTEMPLRENSEMREFSRRIRRDDKLTGDYQLLSTIIDKEEIGELIQQFESVVKRSIDKSFAVKLRREILEPDLPFIKQETMRQLAKWCKTNGIYADGTAVAQKISHGLFGLILDRNKLGA